MDDSQTQVSLRASVKLIYQTKAYSDATIRCGTAQFPVHKAIICSRSIYFKNVLDGQFAEARSGEINVQEELANILEHCLEYLYLDKYVYPETAGPILHAQVYAAADKYCIPGLVALAREHFNDCMKSATPLPGTDIEQVIQQIYNTTTPSTKDLQADLIKHIERCLPQLLEDDQFLSLLQTVDGLAADIMRAQLVPKLPTPRYCDSKFCKAILSLHWIPACDKCGLHNNLRKKKAVETNLFGV